jgi:hypothetical protein
LIHNHLTADIYVNDFVVIVEIRAKRDLIGGQAIGIDDIADIARLKFGQIKIKSTDKIIYCFKVGWKFGLYFNLDEKRSLDIEVIQKELGDLFRHLQFQHIFNVLENEGRFQDLMNDGWFPFLEIIGEDYKDLRALYDNRFDFHNRLNAFIDRFHEARTKMISQKWWSHPLFADKRVLIEAGLDAYYRNDKKGFISCIKNLTPEIEGIIRLHYFGKTGKGKPKYSDLIEHVIELARAKSPSATSLFLSKQFLEYLKKIFFADFDLATGKLTLSRHSAGHGVAQEQDYEKIKALQTILVLDQLYFCMS